MDWERDMLRKQINLGQAFHALSKHSYWDVPEPYRTYYMEKSFAQRSGKSV